MKRFWTALAVASLAILVAASCNDYGNTFQGYTGASVTSLSPSSISAGGPDLTLMVNGSGFVKQTVVLWNNGKLKTTVTLDANGNVTMVTADVPASFIAKPGSASVQTLNPFSGAGNNGLSNPITFVINVAPNPVPAITSINPTSAAPGSGPLTLTITGPTTGPNSFLPTSDPSGGSQVRWNTTTQTNLPLTNVTSSSIQATVSAALLVNAGTATITVYNPPATDPNCQLNCSKSGGGSSNAVTFTIGTVGAAKAAVATAQVQEETPALSQDGRYVAYAALQDGHSQVFLRDTCQSAEASCQPRTILLSVAPDGAAGNGDSHSPSLNSDGRYLAFSSTATNLVENAPKGRQVYLRDTCLGSAATCTPSIQLISTDPNGSLVGAEGILPSVSGSGRFVAFLGVTPSHQLDPAAVSSKPGFAAPNSGYRQVFVRDTCLGAANCSPKTTRVSLQPGDGLDSTPAGPAMSGSSNHVAFAGGSLAALFTRSVAVDDGVFLAIIKERP